MNITQLPNYCYLIRGAKLQNLAVTINTFAQINKNIVIPPTHILIVSTDKKIQTSSIDEKISKLHFDSQFEGEIILLDKFWLQFHKEAQFLQEPFKYLTLGVYPNKKSYKVLPKLTLLGNSGFSNCYFWLI